MQYNVHKLARHLGRSIAVLLALGALPLVAETTDGPQWYPEIPTKGVKNFVPNSSFECGLANWGSFSDDLPERVSVSDDHWGGNLYQLEGEWEDKRAYHGHHSLRICLTTESLPVFFFDYYEPIRKPVRQVLAANQGWFHVKAGEDLTLSAFLRADTEGIVAQMGANEASGHLLRKPVIVGKEWRRYEFSFRPAEIFLFIVLGPDLDASKREAATLWVDAVQLERGDHATDYEPRQPVESFLETGAPGNIFTNCGRGLRFKLLAYNNTEKEQTLRGNLEVTDFFDRRALAREPLLRVPPHSGSQTILAGLCQGQYGFFRANWNALGATQSLRCAVITPARREAADSPLGFNHAYPWNFLVQRARQAGIGWFRDWSAEWQTVEPEKGRFDFAATDNEIKRILDLKCSVDVLLPAPSALWSTSAPAAEVENAQGKSDYVEPGPLAYAPKNWTNFSNYAAEVARHYRQLQPWPKTYIQILNEPIFTAYAMPRRLGYTLVDYLRALEVAGRAVRAADPQCQVIGGISAGVEDELTREFVVKGGLSLVDVFDLHIYETPRPAERYEDSFSSLEELMSTHGGPKPVWITEWGCYADDNPACLPQTVGDATMNQCYWDSERAATENIVKFTAVAFAHGVRKIFFHAGIGGTVNGANATGVLFDYGGTPRKMYAGVAALTRLLGEPAECLKRLRDGGIMAYVFRVGNRTVAIAWCEAEQPRKLRLVAGVAAYDIMGNELTEGSPVLSQSPIYLTGKRADSVLRALTQ